MVVIFMIVLNLWLRRWCFVILTWLTLTDNKASLQTVLIQHISENDQTPTIKQRVNLHLFILFAIQSKIMNW